MNLIQLNQVLHDGFYFKIKDLFISIKKSRYFLYFKNIWSKYKEGNIELMLFFNHLGDGRMANIPWLQELPDPINRTCWDKIYVFLKS